MVSFVVWFVKFVNLFIGLRNENDDIDFVFHSIRLTFGWPIGLHDTMEGKPDFLNNIGRIESSFDESIVAETSKLSIGTLWRKTLRKIVEKNKFSSPNQRSNFVSWRYWRRLVNWWILYRINDQRNNERTFRFGFSGIIHMKLKDCDDFLALTILKLTWSWKASR